MSKSCLPGLVASWLLVSCSGNPTSAPDSPPEYEPRPGAAPSATEATAASAPVTATAAPAAAPSAPVHTGELCYDDRCTVLAVTDAWMAKLELFKDKPEFELELLGATDESLKSLSKVPWLKNLRLTVCNVTDISAVAELKGLRKLDATGCMGITDVKPLSGLTELVEVSLQRTAVKDIAPLANLAKLEALDLGATKIDLAQLKSFKRLKRLSLVGIDAKDWSPLAGLAELEDVSLASTNIKDLQMLAKATKMKRLYASYSQKLADISAVANMSELQHLEIKSTPAKSLAPLAKLAKLERVALVGTNITDLSPLKASVKSKTLKSLLVSKPAENAAEAIKKELPDLELEIQ
jgi:Leucine-rich repeat (LRR) protein